MTQAFIVDAQRTPFGRYGGALSSIRTDDLGALPLKALMARHPNLDWREVSDVIYGCANQAGEDNRNVAHMSSLLAGLPIELPGATINRLCGSGMDAVGTAARTIKSGEAQLMLAGGVESMSRAPFVMPKAESAFSRTNAIYDTTIGWRFVNKRMKELYGVDSMPETAENVATDFKIERAAQDRMALASQLKAVAAQKSGFFDAEICAVHVPQKKGDAVVVSQDEHPRETSLEALTKLKGVVRPDGSVTAGNASGVNDGACALLLCSENATRTHGLNPRARVVAMATAGVAPRIMGFGPAPAVRKVLALAGLTLARTQRGLRRPRPGRAARPRRARRRPARQPQRRSHCAGPPAGCQRRTFGDDGCEPTAQIRRPLCPVHHVHRRGAGDCDGVGAGVNTGFHLLREAP
jgi:3-oxoadipyl-CoA thiolase